MDEFTKNLIGDPKQVIEKMASLILAEESQVIKEKINGLLQEIARRCPWALYFAIQEAKNKGMLKRWDYLNALANY